MEKKTLFICHASEDKADFVRPLAEELRRYFNVWYDEYMLRMGDSLFTKINQGLATSDYGVVVLSQAFFRKNWPQSELNGLHALETQTRKVILPIWKGVTQHDVTASLPILADRVAVDAALGIEKVVEQIRLAVDVSLRTAEIIAPDFCVQHVLRVDQEIQERIESERLSKSEEGVALVKGAFEAMCLALKVKTDTVQKSSAILRFKYTYYPEQVPGPILIVRANGFVLDVEFQGLSANSTKGARLDVQVYPANDRIQRIDDEIDQQPGRKFFPEFRLNKRVLWTDGVNKLDHDADNLADNLMLSLVSMIDHASKRAS